MKASKCLLWFVAGNVVQLIIHAVAINLWLSSQLPFCAAAGFLFCVAIFVGTRISEPVAEKPKHYADYAKEVDGIELEE